MVDDERSRREVRILPAVLAAGVAVAIAVGIVAYAAGRYGERTEALPTQAGSGPVAVSYPKVSPQVAAGAHTFVQFACVQCHGFRGRGGVDPAVPALKTAGQSLTVAQLTHIINHGLGESADPKQPYMPVWGEVLSKTQVADLVAYIQAGLPPVADTQPVLIPAGQGAAVAGAALYVRYGCINCHGPNGLGGVPNPLSADKTIPPLSGGDFRGEFNTDAKIAAVIRSGSVLGQAPIVSMPHWGGILSDQQIAELNAYLKTLK
ncbi:MAG TPA: c-type cytochrome [Gaiellaceae bacterium]|jgi:mono/diheme cytochrome c family protein|nr:c-type cytochrome [Gaiellaceae bacterium]